MVINVQFSYGAVDEVKVFDYDVGTFLEDNIWDSVWAWRFVRLEFGDRLVDPFAGQEWWVGEQIWVLGVRREELVSG